MGLKRVQDDFTDRMKDMLSAAKAPQAGFARLYKLYQKFQTERFKTENQSEGKTWIRLNEIYSTRKRKDFRSFPGSGSKMMIATGTLAGAVIGPGSPFSGTDRHRALFTNTSMQIFVEETGTNAKGQKFDYAGYASEDRPVMEFSDQHIELMKEELRKFFLKG